MPTVTLTANECIAILKRLANAESMAAESAFLKVARAYHAPEAPSWAAPQYVTVVGNVGSAYGGGGGKAN